MKPSRKKCHLRDVGQWASVTQQGHSEGLEWRQENWGFQVTLRKKTEERENQGLGSKAGGKM